MLSLAEEQIAYGCISCFTGREKRLAELINTAYPCVQVVVPEKIRHRRVQKEIMKELVILFPGYVFFKTEPTFPANVLTDLDSVLRLLCDSDGHWQLQGSDMIIVNEIFKQKGVVGRVKACYEGDKVRILDRFFINMMGRVLRVNRRAKTVQLEFPFQNTLMKLWIGLDLIQDSDQEEVVME